MQCKCRHAVRLSLIYSVNGMSRQINCYQFVLIMVSDLKMQMHSTLSIMPGQRMCCSCIKAKSPSPSPPVAHFKSSKQMHTNSHLITERHDLFRVLSGLWSLCIQLFHIFFFGEVTHNRIRIRIGGHMSCCALWARDLSNSLL